MLLINTTKQLEEFCRLLSKQPFITIDSEFIREKSYYPRLCLIQVACESDAAIIDPLADVDLTPFFTILQNEKIVKVFHAGRQDIEIFYNLTGELPQNMFDTQIAAMVCGFTENVSYSNLVMCITGVDLDKSQRLTDWSLRPLDESQLQYAISDVTYLVDCYKYLIQSLKENNREEWIKEEMATLNDVKYYCTLPEDAWQKIRHNVHSPKFLSALQQLAAWRERRAQKYNTPRSSILKDEVLLNIASTFPLSIEELKQVRNLKTDIIYGKLGAEIINVMQEAAEHPMPHDLCRLDRKKNIHIPNHEQSLAEILKLLLRIRCQEEGVVARLVASDEDIRCIILNQPKNTPAMQGWRYEIFGRFAEQICHGKLAIAYNPQKKCIEFR